MTSISQAVLEKGLLQKFAGEIVDAQFESALSAYKHEPFYSPLLFDGEAEAVLKSLPSESID